VTSTADLIAKSQEVIATPTGDDALEGRVDSLKVAINAWVAQYRRDDRFAGRPSFSNMYSAVNALSGHYNSFGVTSRIPKKRLDRIEAEVAQANKFLQMGR
jgi:photosystem II Psb27 protein